MEISKKEYKNLLNIAFMLRIELREKSVKFNNKYTEERVKKYMEEFDNINENID